MSYKNRIIIVFLILFSLFTFKSEAESPDKENKIKHDYTKAKKLISKKNWIEAVKILQKISKNSNENGLKEATLW